jgi:hypothetical protein
VILRNFKCSSNHDRGGNLATGVTLKCIEYGDPDLILPSGLVLIYPVLNFEMACWMPPSQIKLIRTESIRSVTSLPTLQKKVKDRISEYPYYPRYSNPSGIPCSLSMTSRMSYFTDRILAPEVMRGMALLYLGSSPAHYSVQDDYYLSAVNAPDEVLARFPRTYFLTGEKDPLVDDTLVFAGRLRKAKAHAYQTFVHRKKKEQKLGNALGLVNLSPSEMSFSVRERVGEEVLFFGAEKRVSKFSSKEEHPDEWIKVKILEGMSHGFMNMMSFLSEGGQAVQLTANWFIEMLEESDYDFSTGPTNEFERERMSSLTNSDLHESPVIVETMERQRKLSTRRGKDPDLIEVHEKQVMERRREELAFKHLGQ